MINLTDHREAFVYEKKYASRIDPYTDEPYFPDAMTLGYATEEEAQEFFDQIKHLIPEGVFAEVDQQVDFGLQDREWAVALYDREPPDESCGTWVAHISDVPSALNELRDS